MICMATLAEQDPSDACTSCRRPFHSDCIQQWVVNSASPWEGEERPAQNPVTLVHLLDHSTARCPHCRTPAAFPAVVQRIRQQGAMEVIINAKVAVIKHVNAKLHESDFNGLLNQAVQQKGEWVHTKLLDLLIALQQQFVEITKEAHVNAFKTFTPTVHLSQVNFEGILNHMIHNELLHEVRKLFYRRLGRILLFDLSTSWGKNFYLLVTTTARYLEACPEGSSEHGRALKRTGEIMNWINATWKDAMLSSYASLYQRDSIEVIRETLDCIEFDKAEFETYIHCCKYMKDDYDKFHAHEQAKAKRARNDSDGAGPAQKRTAV